MDETVLEHRRGRFRLPRSCAMELKLKDEAQSRLIFFCLTFTFYSQDWLSLNKSAFLIRCSQTSISIRAKPV
jgi:hypothetical protein